MDGSLYHGKLINLIPIALRQNETVVKGDIMQQIYIAEYTLCGLEYFSSIVMALRDKDFEKDIVITTDQNKEKALIMEKYLLNQYNNEHIQTKYLMYNISVQDKNLYYLSNKSLNYAKINSDPKKTTSILNNSSQIVLNQYFGPPNTQISSPTIKILSNIFMKQQHNCYSHYNTFFRTAIQLQTINRNSILYLWLLNGSSKSKYYFPLLFEWVRDLCIHVTQSYDNTLNWIDTFKSIMKFFNLLEPYISKFNKLKILDLDGTIITGRLLIESNKNSILQLLLRMKELKAQLPQTESMNSYYSQRKMQEEFEYFKFWHKDGKMRDAGELIIAFNVIVNIKIMNKFGSSSQKCRDHILRLDNNRQNQMERIYQIYLENAKIFLQYQQFADRTGHSLRTNNLEINKQTLFQ